MLALVSLAVLAALGGCATMVDATTQEVEVRTVLDHTEVGDIGCILSNRHGRWFVTTPGRVTVHKSDDSLSFDCRKAGVGRSVEAVASRYGAGKMVGNALVSAGTGYYLDRHTGAGFDYPSVVTVLMQAEAGPGAAAITEAGATMY